MIYLLFDIVSFVKGSCGSVCNVVNILGNLNFAKNLSPLRVYKLGTTNFMTLFLNTSKTFDC